MKLRTKLIVAFFTIILVPIFIVYLGVSMFTTFQLRSMVSGYTGSTIGDLFAGNAVSLISGMTADIYDEIQTEAAENPAYFDDAENLDRLNEDLNAAYSFLAVRTEETFSYMGGG